MTLRPIDMQVLLPRVPEVSRAQQIHNQHDQNQAQQFASELNKQVKHAENQVQTTDQAEGKSINQDKENSSSGKKQGKQEGRKAKDQDVETSLPGDPNKGTHLDIKI